jgi:hypothetical protein
MDYEGLYNDLNTMMGNALTKALFGAVDFNAAFQFAAECGDFRYEIEQSGLAS